MTGKQRNENRRIILESEKARQGYIALKTPARRRVFFGGLIGFVLFVFLVSFFAGA